MLGSRTDKRGESYQLSIRGIDVCPTRKCVKHMYLRGGADKGVRVTIPGRVPMVEVIRWIESLVEKLPNLFRY